MDPSKKTMRHFYCRDVLWETFELMANDFDCSIDYLINEAMRFYARSKNYQVPAGNSLSGLAPASSLSQPGLSPSRPPPPPPPSPSRPPPPPPVSVAAQTGPLLYLIFNNQRYPIDKDQFIIGRGSKTSDLSIKDGNISRKHAAIIRRNGIYYIKDLGSTNGIDYKGMRIDNKRIDEGDVFHICDYELKFTYHQ
ncbi:MAG: FHA domain-containing protein [Myxococcales bacterium]|nr:FHA domain-containing protein [Myxococcota bacterium]MDW8281282.1 FHA domain-containing protein [Myxococcales bacterium]